MKEIVLIVDDLADNRKLLANIIQKNTNYDVIIAKNGIDVIDRFNDINSKIPDLILLDVMMPKMNGFEVAEILKKKPHMKDIPIIFVTGLSDSKNILKAFEKGGVDYIPKPFNKNELLARIETHLRLKRALKELEQKNLILKDRESHLEYLVEEKTKKLDNLTVAMISALENVNLYNDTDTGNHIKRVSEYSVLIAQSLNCNDEFIKKIKTYSSLHDIGKVGIPDVILKKKDKYTHDEFEKMKKHVQIGGKMLDNPEIDIMAKNIALYHHEKWDGTGYIKGLKGEEIPLEARIIAIADVYDALTTERSYKKAFSEEKTVKIIKKGSGKHFDPNIVKVFIKCEKKIIEIRNKFK